jgi:diaminopimelate epimerase
MDGGELLITWTEAGVLMRGPAITAFAGVLPDLV